MVGHLLSGWPTLRPIFPRKTIQQIRDASIRFNRIIIAHRSVIAKCLETFNALVRVWTRVLKVGDVMRACLTKSLKFLLGIVLFGLRSFQIMVSWCCFVDKFCKVELYDLFCFEDYRFSFLKNICLTETSTSLCVILFVSLLLWIFFLWKIIFFLCLIYCQVLLSFLIDK